MARREDLFTGVVQSWFDANAAIQARAEVILRLLHAEGELWGGPALDDWNVNIGSSEVVITVNGQRFFKLSAQTWRYGGDFDTFVFPLDIFENGSDEDIHTLIIGWRKEREDANAARKAEDAVKSLDAERREYSRAPRI